jgi:hypothetical protein
MRIANGERLSARGRLTFSIELDLQGRKHQRQMSMDRRNAQAVQQRICQFEG